MARSRNIKPGFFQNDLLAEKPPLTRILFAALWPIADRDGRLEDRPKRLKALCLPFDDCDVDAALDDLAAGPDPFIVRYEVDGRRYVQVVNWHKHQSPHVREPESVIPEAPDKPVPRTGLEPDEPVGSGLRVKGIRLKESGKGNQDPEGGPGETKPIPELPPSIRTPAMAEAVGDWLAYKAERREKYKPTGLKAFYTHLSGAVAQHGEEVIIARMRKAMASSWKGWDHADARGSPPANGSAPRTRSGYEIVPLE